jgi:hypothetical protein
MSANVPDLGFFIDLHAQLPSVFVDWTVIDTTGSSNVDDSATPLVAVGKSEAHLYIAAHWPSCRHELRAFIGIFDENCLLEALVYNELVLHKIVINLRVVS